MARTDPQVNFRIPAALNEQLKESAAANNRTVTAELVHRLEASFAVGPGPDPLEDGFENQLTGAWIACKEHLDFLRGEVAEMEALAAQTKAADLNKDGQAPGWTPPDPLPEWASLNESLAFYRSWRDRTQENLRELTAKVFFVHGIVPPNSSQPKHGKPKAASPKRKR